METLIMDKEHHQATPTPEDVWKILRAISARQEKFDREFEKQQAETDRRLKESAQETEEINKVGKRNQRADERYRPTAEKDGCAV